VHPQASGVEASRGALPDGRRILGEKGSNLRTTQLYNRKHGKMQRVEVERVQL
jgi:hypothetical protein